MSGTSAFALRPSAAAVRTAPLLAGVVVLLVASGSMGGAPGAVVHRPPFTLVSEAGKDSFISSPNGSVVSTTPFFNGTTGHGGYSTKAVVPTCRRVCNLIEADDPATLTFSLLVPVPRAATSVVLNATLGWTVTVHDHPGSCHFRNVTGTTSQCALKMFWLMLLFPITLYDNTSGTSHRASKQNFSTPPRSNLLGSDWGESWSNVTGCAYSSSAHANVCGSTGTFPNTTTFTTRLYWNAAFNITPTTTKHQYVLRFGFVWATELIVSSIHARWSSVSANLGLQMARLGNGIAIRTITVS